MSSKMKILEQSNKGALMQAPALRFPEFTNNWSIRNLSELVNIKTGKKNTQDKVSDGQYPFFVRSQQIEKIDTYSFDGEAILTAGDGVGVGKVFHYIKGKFDYHQRVYCLSGFRDFVFGKYIYEVFKNNFGAETAKYSAKNSVDSVRLEMISGMKIPLPSLSEQQKIADCLSSLDNVISLQAKKIDVLQQDKKGLMQKLFPTEGKTMPELRFPEFKPQGKWEQRQLGEITKFASGGTPSKDIADYWNGTIPWISASSMYSTKLNKSTLNVTNLAIGNGTRIAKKGNLLILVRGSMLFNRIPMGIAEIDVAFNQDVKSLSIDKKMNTVFLLNQLMAFESRIAINETGIGAGKIETEDLKRLNVYMPSISEQKQIADCLSSFDELIDAETRKLATLKIHKTGLMQQLFPKMGEING